MNRLLKLCSITAFLLLASIPVLGQTTIQHGSGTPSSSNCNITRHYGRVYQNDSTTPPTVYTCGSSGWVLLTSNSKMYDAHVNGGCISSTVTDNTTCLSNALTQANLLGLDLFLPNGTWLNSGITIPYGVSVWCAGAPTSSTPTTLLYSGSTVAVAFATVDSFEPNMGIHNCSIQKQGVNGSSVGIGLNGTHRAVVSGNDIYNFYTGIDGANGGSGSSGTYSSFITHNRIRGVTIGIYGRSTGLQGFNNNTVAGNRCTEATVYCYLFDNTAKDNELVENNAEGFTGSGVMIGYLITGTNNNVHDNWCESVLTAGQTLTCYQNNPGLGDTFSNNTNGTTTSGGTLICDSFTDLLSDIQHPASITGTCPSYYSYHLPGGTTSINEYHAIASSASPVFNKIARNQSWSFTIPTGGATGATTSGLASGDSVFVAITQCSTIGGCNFTWPTGFSSGCLIAAADRSTGAANLVITQSFTMQGSTAVPTSACITNASTSDIVILDGVNTFTAAGTIDLSSSTMANSFRTQVKAGATATASGSIAYDSTADMFHGGQANADSFIPQFTAIPANNDCANWVVSGSKYKLGTAGSACSGSVTHTHTLAAGAFGGSAFMVDVFNQSNTVGAACPTPADLHFIPVVIPVCYLLWFEDGTTNATHGIVVMDEVPSFVPSAVKLTLVWMDHGSAATYQYKVAYAVTTNAGVINPPTFSTAQNFGSQLSVAGHVYVQTITLTGISFVADNLLTMAIGRVDAAGYGHLIQANVEYVP